MVDFVAGLPDLTHPPPLPRLDTSYVETTQESLERVGDEVVLRASTTVPSCIEIRYVTLDILP